MEKPNLVPSSVIFLFLQQHFLFFFFFLNSAPKTPRASAVWVVWKKESSRSQILETLWEEITGEDVQEELRWVGSFSLWWSDESFSLRVLQKKRDKKKKTKRRDPHSSVFSDAAVDEILSDCCRSSRGRGGAFISLPSWTPWTSATPSTWTRTGNKTFIVSLKQSRLFRSQRVQIQFCFIG